MKLSENVSLFALLAILIVVGTLTGSSVYAEHHEDDEHIEDSNIPQACVGCSTDDATENKLKEKTGVSIWTDKIHYKHNDVITISGQIENSSLEIPVTLSVINPLNSVVITNTLQVGSDGDFKITLNTASGTMWEYDGTYTINTIYGNPEKSNSVKIELDGEILQQQSDDKDAIIEELELQNKMLGEKIEELQNIINE